jgi:hypothetical protein
MLVIGSACFKGLKYSYCFVTVTYVVNLKIGQSYEMHATFQFRMFPFSALNPMIKAYRIIISMLFCMGMEPGLTVIIMGRNRFRIFGSQESKSYRKVKKITSMRIFVKFSPYVIRLIKSR